MGEKISAMSAASALDGTELVNVVQGGASKQTTAGAIKTLAQSGLATVASSGAYSDLSGKPSLGSIASHSTSDFDASGSAASAQTAAEAYADAQDAALRGALAGLNDQTGTAYTIAATDAGKDIRCTNAAAVTVSIDTQANVPVKNNFVALVSQGGAGAVTIAALSGVTLRTPNGASTSSQYDARGIEFLGSDTWRVW